jgi:hypothetical protein
MMNTPDGDRQMLRRRASKPPGTPETTSSSELGCDVYLDADNEPKADLFQTLHLSGEITNYIRERKQTPPTSKDDHKRKKSGLIPPDRSAVARAERQMIEDDNSILASQRDEQSHHSTFYSFDVMFDQEEDSTSYVASYDGDLQAAIDVIRKEASQIDQLILYDQLKTLECELETINRQYSARSMENEDLKAQLEEKEDRVSKLELERDLYQADATKLREDLRTCVEKMFDISLYESTTEDGAIPERIEAMKRILLRAPSGEQERADNLSPDAHPQQLRVLGLTSHPRKVISTRMPILSDPGLLTLSSRRKWSEDSDSIHLLPSTKDREPVRSQDVFRRQGHPSFRRQKTKVSSKPPSTDGHTERKRKPTDSLRSRSFSVERIIYHQPSVTDSEKNETKMCGIFRRRSKQSQNSKHSNIQMLRNQIKQLQELMETSLSSSEKLRKRIATISRYYEGVIGQLQTQVAEIKADKWRNESDLKNQLLEAERMICAKDREIARLVAALAEVDQGEV